MSDIELELLAQAYREAAAAIKELEAQQEALRAKMIAELENRGAEEVEVEVEVPPLLLKHMDQMEAVVDQVEQILLCQESGVIRAHLPVLVQV